MFSVGLFYYLLPALQAIHGMTLRISLFSVATVAFMSIIIVILTAINWTYLHELSQTIPITLESAVGHGIQIANGAWRYKQTANL